MIVCAKSTILHGGYIKEHDLNSLSWLIFSLSTINLNFFSHSSCHLLEPSAYPDLRWPWPNLRWIVSPFLLLKMFISLLCMSLLSIFSLLWGNLWVFYLHGVQGFSPRWFNIFLLIFRYGRIYCLQFDRVAMLLHSYRFYRDAVVQQVTFLFSSVLYLWLWILSL